MAQIEL